MMVVSEINYYYTPSITVLIFFKHNSITRSIEKYLKGDHKLFMGMACGKIKAYDIPKNNL